MFAGPTEVLIVADDKADPFTCASECLRRHFARQMFEAQSHFLTADLLSQAEHGPDTPAVMITTSEEVGKKTLAHIEEQLYVNIAAN